MDTAIEMAAKLALWSGPIELQPLTGGITNTNFLAVDAGKKYVVRIGEDIAVHGVKRQHELAASKAAEATGISPAIVFSEPGAMVMDFIEGRTLEALDIRAPRYLDQIMSLIRCIHHDMPRFIRGARWTFSVFDVLRDYRQTLEIGNSRMRTALPRLEKISATLEEVAGVQEPVFGHNDLLAANFIDDGAKLWVIDWDYAGFGSPLFDLSNLASNNEFNVDLEHRLLENYFGSAVETNLWRSYSAMKCASLLREAMWSMVSEIHSELEFDYVSYTAENLERFEQAYGDFRQRA